MKSFAFAPWQKDETDILLSSASTTEPGSSSAILKNHRPPQVQHQQNKATATSKNERMNTWPQSLRPVAKYIARVNEVEASNPFAAFYCNVHAAKEAIRVSKGDGDAFIHSLLEKT